MRFEDLPYRPCVGVLVLNRAGLVFIGRRIEGRSMSTRRMPGRCRRAASTKAKSHGRRRCASCTRKPISAPSSGWAKLPTGCNTTSRATIVGQAWKGKYRGQTQKWFAMRFTGDESEIDIAHPAGAHEPEFAAWRWEPMRNIPSLVVPFKRAVYERVVGEFAYLAGA